MKGKTLIADAESLIRIMLRDFLKEKGYAVIAAHDEEDALDQFAQNPEIPLIILDIMMRI